MLTSSRLLNAAAASVAMLFAAPAAHAAQIYNVDFTALNGSGVTGSAVLTLNDDASMLTVQILASGLTPDMNHPGHIHGRFTPSGMPMNSVVPPPSADTDGDGFVELGEGAPFYGPVILPFGELTDPGPEAPLGVLSYMETFNLLDASIYGEGFTREDLLGPGLNSLQLREIVLHGMFVPPGPGAGTSGEVDGTNGYLTLLPVAAGQIQPSNMAAVPEPGTWAMMLLGFGATGFAIRRRRKDDPHLAQIA